MNSLLYSTLGKGGAPSFELWFDKDGQEEKEKKSRVTCQTEPRKALFWDISSVKFITTKKTEDFFLITERPGGLSVRNEEEGRFKRVILPGVSLVRMIRQV